MKIKFKKLNLKKFNLSRALNLSRFKNATIIILALAIFVLVNYLISAVAIRVDFSKGQSYTLSSSTKKILKEVSVPITIKLFASSTLPTKILPLKSDVIDLLKEYQKENKKDITIQIIDPKTDQKALSEAQSNGLPELQFSQVEQDKYALSAAYFGMVISTNGNSEILPQITDVETLEYNLTSSIYKLTKKTIPKVTIIGKQQNTDPSTNDISTFSQLLSKQFDVNFSQSIDNTVKTIAVFDDNSKKYSEEELTGFKKYLQMGGKAIFFVDGTWITNSMTVESANHNLFSLFKEYGVTLNQDLVLSNQSELVNFGNGLVSFLIPYPFWVKTNNFNPQSSYFQNVNQLTFPWASSLTVKKVPGVTVTNLVYTTKNSWEEKNNFDINPQNIVMPKSSELKESLLVVSVKLKSGGEFVIIPTSRFVLEKYLSQTSNNPEFVLNILDDYASGGALAGIKSRQVSFYPLPDLTETQKQIFKYSNILVLPILFILYGLVRIIKKNKKSGDII